MAIKNKRSSDVKPESPAEKKVKFDNRVSTSGQKKVFSKTGGKSIWVPATLLYHSLSDFSVFL